MKKGAANYGVAIELQEDGANGRAGRTRGVGRVSLEGTRGTRPWDVKTGAGQAGGKGRRRRAYGAEQGGWEARGLDSQIRIKGVGSPQPREGGWGPVAVQCDACKMRRRRRRRRMQAGGDVYVGYERHNGSAKGAWTAMRRTRSAGHM